MKKVTVTATVRILIHANEEADVDEVMQEMNYEFIDTTGTADVIDTELQDFKVKDSR